MYQDHDVVPVQSARMFKASRVWESNVWGATVAGIGGALLMATVAGIFIFDSQAPKGFAVLLMVTIAATLIAMFPGNLIAAVPVAVELQEGKGLLLIAPLKKVYIPLNEIGSIRESAFWQMAQQGTVVKLTRRHGLMKSFAIHWAFGDQGKELITAIKEEIRASG